MECKSGSTSATMKTIAELIETLWNVNLFDSVAEGISDIELIETLWNVNILAVITASLKS